MKSQFYDWDGKMIHETDSEPITTVRPMLAIYRGHYFAFDIHSATASRRIYCQTFPVWDVDSNTVQDDPGPS
jgi:hypothetical protein